MNRFRTKLKAPLAIKKKKKNDKQRWSGSRKAKMDHKDPQFSLFSRYKKNTSRPIYHALKIFKSHAGLKIIFDMIANFFFTKPAL